MSLDSKFKIDDFIIPMFNEPTKAEMQKRAEERRAPAEPFDLDQWPEDIKNLSIATRLIEIPSDEIKGLYGDGQTVGPACKTIAELVDKNLNSGEKVFIKLSSRSPKDASYPNAPIVESGKEAAYLLANSERCLTDSIDMIEIGKPVYLALRDVVPIHPEQEIRCYVLDGELIAIARYDYHNEAGEFWNDLDKDQIIAEMKSYYARNIMQHHKTVVFDIALGMGAYAAGQSVKGSGVNEAHLLIELNPYGLSDPCGFKSYETLELNHKKGVKVL